MVVDHWPLARTAIGSLLRDSGAAGTVMKAESAEAARVGFQDVRADVVITDCDLKGPRDGLRLGWYFKGLERPPMVLVYSERNDLDVVIECREGAADSFVHRSVEPDVLVEAVRRLVSGRQTWITSDQPVPGRRSSAPSDDWPCGDVLAGGMTAREREVLELLLRRYSNDEIAVQLHLARQTVKNYVSTVMQKLEVSSRRELHGWARAANPWRSISELSRR